MLSFNDKIASSISDLSSVMTHPSSKIRANISHFPDPNDRHKKEVSNLNRIKSSLGNEKLIKEKNLFLFSAGKLFT